MAILAYLFIPSSTCLGQQKMSYNIKATHEFSAHFVEYIAVAVYVSNYHDLAELGMKKRKAT